MTTTKEYRSYADECLGWAGTAKSERERRIFLQMAEAWIEAVARREARITTRQPSRVGPQLGNGSHA